MAQTRFIGGTELLDPVALLERIGVRAGQHIADLGCGVTGHYIIPAARMVGAQGKVYAVDVQQSVLAGVESRAKLEGLSNITYVWSDIERVGATQIAAGLLDVALIVNTLSMTKDRVAAMREAARLVNPGGRVVVVEWKTVATPVGPAAAQRMSAQDVRAAAAAARLDEESAFDAGPYHYGVAFRKPV